MVMEVLVPVSRPQMGDAEIAFVNEAMRESAISGLYGTFLDRFEEEFAAFCGTRYAVTCSNGTTALHLALVAAGVKAGDEVLVSTLTNMASFFAVLYIGAKPVPVDIDRATLTMDPVDLANKITGRSKAIMVVHLFGQMTEMEPVNQLAKNHGLLVVEDCAEAHGATYRDKVAGSLGDAGCFSFFANKIITTGEGGMLTTNDAGLANKARNLKALAFGSANKFMHQDIGYNYRMTNVQAAIGCGQMLKANDLIEKRREIARFYTNRLTPYSEHIDFPVHRSHAKNVIWMYHLVLKGALLDKRTEIMGALREQGIETREGFIPFNLQDIFLVQGIVERDTCPVANSVAYSSFYLPTGPAMDDTQLDYVASKFCQILDRLI